MQETRTSPDPEAYANPPPAADEADPHATRWRFVRRFAIGLALYGVIIAGYLFVLRLSGEPLLRLYNTHLGSYALLALVLIILQGIALESITSFLAEHLGIVTHEGE